MFTGLIEAVGAVAAMTPGSSGLRLQVTTELAAELNPGDSLAVNGVCLTVVTRTAESVEMDVAPETLRVTTLGSAAAGDLVNLERPLRADARLGGHFVQGHVDATGEIDGIRREGDAYRITVRFPESLAPYIVRKGSIAVDGISLTVADVSERSLDVQIIPFTWTHTNLHAAGTGRRVNLETDILGKYLLRSMELRELGRNP